MQNFFRALVSLTIALSATAIAATTPSPTITGSATQTAAASPSPTSTPDPSTSPLDSPADSPSPTSTPSPVAIASTTPTPEEVHEIQIPLPNLKGININPDANKNRTAAKSPTPNQARSEATQTPDQPSQEVLKQLQTLSPNNILIQEKGTAKPIGYIPTGWTVELLKDGKIRSSPFQIAPGFVYSFTVNPYQLVPDPTQGKYPMHEPVYRTDKSDPRPITIDQAIKQLGVALDKQQKNLDTLIQFIQAELPEEISNPNASSTPTDTQAPDRSPASQN